MNVRDAVEADADALATMADSPTDVMRNLVHDRTVRVAESDPDSPAARDAPSAETRSGSPDAREGHESGPEPEDLLGFVSFDAKEDTVHVTQIDGSTDACRRLLTEPVRFAEREEMAVEVLVRPDHDVVTDALESLRFERRGFGPRFDGQRTVQFRLEP